MYDRPSYYSGYYLADIPGNINLHGTAPAEINHSSIVAHFGESGAWSLVYQIKKLLDRQRHFLKKDLKMDDMLFMSNRNLQSDFDGKLGELDVEAKRSLTTYAYNEIWLRNIKTRGRLQFRIVENSLNYVENSSQT